MVFGNNSQSHKRQERNHIKPIKILTNALVSVSQTVPMSSSLPFPVDELPVRKIKTSDSMLDLNDPSTYRPRPNGVHVDAILQQATCAGWLTKHRAPTFSFMKNIKRRYIVLVDRMLYAFKSETPDTYREFLELTKTTYAFVTDQFAGELFCIEIKKMGHDDASSWFLQADDAESMKLWLDRIKRTIATLRAGHSGTITKDSLTKVTTEEEEYALIATKARREMYSSPTSSQSNISFDSVEHPHRENHSRPQSLNSSFITSNMTSQPSSPVSTQTTECESVASFPSSAGLSSEYPMERNNSYNSSSPRRQSSLRVTRPNLANYVMSSVLPPQLPPPKSQPPPIPSYAYL